MEQNNIKIEYSIIIPIFNEEGTINELSSRLIQTMKSLSDYYEIIFINDGSKDNSLKLIEKLSYQDCKIKIIDLSRNFGHEIAITAGLDYAKGEAIIIMDGDLQHPPEVIPELIKKWKNGYEIINTIRQDNKEISLFKKFSAILFYKLMINLTGIDISYASNFKLIDKKVLNSLKSIRERIRFLRGLIKWIGFKQEKVKYVAQKRYAGYSKYSIKKMIKLAIDGITSFTLIPLRIATYIGIIVSLISFIYGLYVLYIKLFTNYAVPGWTSLLGAVLFLGGIQLLTIGVMGEYIGRIYEETKQRPLYFIRKTWRINKKNNEL